MNRKHVTPDRLIQLRNRWKTLNAALAAEPFWGPHYFRLSELHARAHEAYFGAELA